MIQTSTSSCQPTTNPRARAVASARRICALGASTALALAAPSLALSAITDGLVAYYPFNGDAQDASGNGNHGAVNGNVTYVDGPVGKAAKFNGVNSQGGGQNPDHILVRNSASLKMTNAMTVSYWVKFNSSNSQTWADCSGKVVNETSGHVLAKSGDRTGFYFGEGEVSTGFGIAPYDGGRGLDSGTNRLPSALSQYRHIAYTINGNAISLYVNGQLLTQGTGQVDYASANNQNMYIGAMHSQGFACLNFWGQLDGSVDELRIYNRALSASEVQELKSYSTTSDASIFGANSLDNYYVLDTIKTTTETYILATKRLSPATFFTNPDGVRSYKSEVVLFKITSDGKYKTTKITESYPFNDAPGYDTGGLMTLNGRVYAFHNSAASSSNTSYGMNGYLSTIDATTMTVTAHSQLFANANWGWYPIVTSPASVTHFSFAGYRKMVNTSDAGSISPQNASIEAAQNRVGHAGGLFNETELNQINGTFRSTYIQRLIPAAASAPTATPCPDQIFPWPYKYADGTLCLPVVNIPGGNGAYTSFYTTWKTNTPSAANPTYFITDARQYPSTISGNTLFDPVFYKSETNTIDAYFPDVGWTTERYEVLLQEPLGLKKIPSTNTTPTPTPTPTPVPQSCTGGTTTLIWQGTSGATCSALATNSASGQQNFIGSSNGNTGSATFTCTDGIWSSPTSATCTAPAPSAQSCVAATLSWTGATGQSCSATSAVTSSGQGLSLSNTLGNGNTGSANFTCTNGSWSNATSATCTTPAPAAPTCDPNSKSC